jgi:hypothetical protein
MKFTFLTYIVARTEAKLNEALNAPSVEEERSQLKKELLGKTRQRVKLAKGYIVSHVRCAAIV